MGGRTEKRRYVLTATRGGNRNKGDGPRPGKLKKRTRRLNTNNIGYRSRRKERKPGQGKVLINGEGIEEKM